MEVNKKYKQTGLTPAEIISRVSDIAYKAIEISDCRFIDSNDESVVLLNKMVPLDDFLKKFKDEDIYTPLNSDYVIDLYRNYLTEEEFDEFLTNYGVSEKDIEVIKKGIENSENNTLLDICLDSLVEFNSAVGDWERAVIDLAKIGTNYKKEYTFDPGERTNLDQDTHMTIEICSNEGEDWLEVNNYIFCDCQGDSATNAIIDEVIEELDITLDELMDRVSIYYPEIERINIGLDYFFYVPSEEFFNNGILNFLDFGDSTMNKLYHKIKRGVRVDDFTEKSLNSHWKANKW